MTDDTEWTCADCDHVQRGHRFHCEKCGHNFGTVQDAEVGDGQLWTTPEMLRDKLLEVEAATIERCAQVAESVRTHFFNHTVEMSDAIAAAIRALKDS